MLQGVAKSNRGLARSSGHWTMGRGRDTGTTAYNKEFAELVLIVSPPVDGAEVLGANMVRSSRNASKWTKYRSRGRGQQKSR